MTVSHLIAVNCHGFHALTDITRCLDSVAEAVREFSRHRSDPVKVRVYWHASAQPPQHLGRQVDAYGFDLVIAPGAINGENLNRQIDDALRDRFDLFYRVDGDDTVALRRFLRQADMMLSGTCDLCGGGLRYEPIGGESYLMQPSARPGPRDFLENQFVLHPSMAFRLDAVGRSGLRYWSRRLEDKALLLQARKAGLRIHNLSALVGTYTLDPAARNHFAQKWSNLMLNMDFLFYSRCLHYVPYAVMLFVLHVLLGSDRLRRIRFVLRRGRPRPAPDAEPATEHRKPVVS